MKLRSANLQTLRAFTLVEAMLALAAIGLIATTIIYSFLTLNKYTARARDLTSAKALCQEKIEESLSVVYDPANGNIPALLTAGSTDTVKVYVKQDNTTTMLTGTRTLTVSTADATLKLLRITVNVAYSYLGKNYVYQMATLRAPD